MHGGGGGRGGLAARSGLNLWTRPCHWCSKTGSHLDSGYLVLHYLPTYNTLRKKKEGRKTAECCVLCRMADLSKSVM